jgi:hypothetical protein
MIDPPQLHAAAARFGPAINEGILEFGEAYDILCRCALANPACRDMPSPAFDALCGRLANTMADSAEQPALSASQRVRDAMRPLLAARRPRDTVMLAAYRAGGDDLTVQEIEFIAREEVTYYLENRRAG